MARTTALRMEQIAWVPRGLSREEAAYYLGIGTTLFDRLVADRRMPRAKRIDGRAVWDRVQLDMAFSELDEARGNWIDQELDKAS